MLYKYSIVNNAFYAAHNADIHALSHEVGNLAPSIVGQVTGLRTVDIRELATPVNLYTVPPTLDGETANEYGLRVRDEVVAGVDQIIAGTLDGLVIDDESGIELYRQLVGWNEPVVI